MGFSRRQRSAIALAAWTAALGPVAVHAQAPPDKAPPTSDEAAPTATEPSAPATTKVLEPEELEQVAAPIALYPDALLAQVVMAATYPLEIVQAARWVKENEKLEGKALEEATQKQPWDPSVKSLTPFPQVLAMMSEKLDWTQKLGDALLAQEADLMDAVQRLRAKAKAEGHLESTKEQKVAVEKDESGEKEVIVIQPSNPEIVYVPSYNPAVVYGAWPYPAYPPYAVYPPGYVAAAGIVSFGVGMAVGAAMWGGVGWGWGGSQLNVNVNNYNRVNRTNVSSARWQHNAEHRRGVQYRDPGSRQRYGREAGGAAAREAYRGRQASGEARSPAERSDARQQRSQGRAESRGQRTEGRSQARETREGGAFEGARGGGTQARLDSARGQASRGGGGGFRGGGARGGGGGRRR